DAAYFAQQQNAEAILAERTAKAKAIAKRNEALRGSGGRAMVKLKVAEAIEGKSIVLVPGGQAGASFNRLDVNKMIDAFKDEPPGPRLLPQGRRPPRRTPLRRASSQESAA